MQEVFEHGEAGSTAISNQIAEAPCAPTAANEALAAPAPLSIADSQPTRGMQALIPADVEEIANRPATTNAASIAPTTEAPEVRGFPPRVR